jgi:DNA-binding GntR family transcriptional regulator
MAADPTQAGASLQTGDPVPRTLADAAVSILHAAILNGDFAPGERLRIEDLAARLDMSPMPVREALRELDALGLVEHTPHRGAKVAELSLDDLRETAEVRLALETLAVRRAAEVFTAEDAQVAERHLADWDRAKRSKETHTARIEHARFHLALYTAARSRWLLRSIRPVWENGERYRLESVDDKATLSQRMAEHERILRFCVEHRPDDAADEFYNHLVMTTNLVARKLGGGDLFEFRDSPAD